MEKKYRRIILLFLSSENTDLYKFFIRMQRSYMNSWSDVQFLFAFSDLNREPLEYEYVYGKRFSTLRETMVMQTLHAMERLDEEYEYDYIIRTNLSTIWLLDRLINRIDSIKDELSIYGRIGQIPPKFIVGQDLVIPRVLVKRMLESREELVKYSEKSIGKAEDRVLSEFLQYKVGANVVNCNNNILVLEHITLGSDGMMEKVFSQIDSNTDFDHIRIKNNIHNRNEIDRFVGTEILKRYYEGVK